MPRLHGSRSRRIRVPARGGDAAEPPQNVLSQPAAATLSSHRDAGALRRAAGRAALPPAAASGFAPASGRDARRAGSDDLRTSDRPAVRDNGPLPAGRMAAAPRTLRAGVPPGPLSGAALRTARNRIGFPPCGPLRRQPQPLCTFLCADDRPHGRTPCRPATDGRLRLGFLVHRSRRNHGRSAARTAAHRLSAARGFGIAQPAPRGAEHRAAVRHRRSRPPASATARRRRNRRCAG